MEDRAPRFRIGQLATRTGVPHERLRKWETRYGLLAPERSEGGFRLYSLEDEQRVRLMERHQRRGYAAAEAAELAREGVVSPAPARLGERIPEAVVRRTGRLLHEALLDYNEMAAERALDDLFAAFKVEAVLRDAILPFLRRTGDAWEGGELVPGQEHFASTIVQARLSALTRGWGSGRGPRALLACPSGERHTLGLLIFGIVLARRGWRITFLGADTPAASLDHAASRIRPAVVVLAATTSRRYSAAATELAAIAREHDLRVAGEGATELAAARIDAHRITTDPVTAAAALADARRRNGNDRHAGGRRS